MTTSVFFSPARPTIIRRLHDAIEHGYRVLFTTAAAMIGTLTRALSEGRLEGKLKMYTVPRLLLVDEIGYLPIDRVGANLFFQLISRR